MLSAMIVVAPPAVHPRIASLLGDTAELKFISHTSIKQQAALSEPSDWADRAYLELPDEVDFPTALLSELLRVLKKGSKICIRHRKGDAQSWVDQLVFAGFVDAAETEGDGVMFETVGAKPPWDTAAAIPLKRKAKTASANNSSAAPAPAPANGAKKVWTISADDAEEDLMDEDSLLNEEDLKPQPKKENKESDCSTSRKACKNCSCGRAEMEAEAETNGSAPSAAPTSACGNCYLGDAFRCAGCPYRGQAPFKPGEKVQIDLD